MGRSGKQLGVCLLGFAFYKLCFEQRARRRGKSSEIWCVGLCTHAGMRDIVDEWAVEQCRSLFSINKYVCVILCVKILVMYK